MSVVSIYESEVSCLSSILDLQRRCMNEKLNFSNETNRFLLHLTLKKVGPHVAQKVVSKLVAKGEITWDAEEEFDVEQILDYVEEDGVDFYLIKWKGWSHAHNSWEPKGNLDCINLMDEFHQKNSKELIRAGTKRKFDEIKCPEDDRAQKRSRIDELYAKLITCKETMTPLKLIALTSPDKGRPKAYRGLVSCQGMKVPKFNNTGNLMLNPRTKAYKVKKVEIKKALQDWENAMNAVLTDPAKITVENDVDLEGPPENFVYINDYKPGVGIEIPNEPVIGCECTDCFTEKKSCCAHEFGVDFAYYKQKRLRIPPGRPIYECNKRCQCGPDCSNRVVQHGRRHKVCIFRTKNGRGWGVKALQKIKAGTFVMEYVGEVISSEEAEIRGKNYDSVGRTYLFDLDFNDGDCPFTVDAAIYGNVSHFVNHSCDPNLEVYSVWINTLDPRLPRIALFSRRDIEKGEELTFDYMSSNVHSPLEESSKVEAIAKSDSANIEATTLDENENTVGEEITEKVDIEEVSEREQKSENEQTSESVQTSESEQTSENGDQLSLIDNDKLETEVAPPMPLPGGDAESALSQSEVRSSPRKAPPPVEEQDMYRMVCQCGAKNCRKFVF